VKRLAKTPAKKDEGIELKREMARLKRESNTKIKVLQLEVTNQAEKIERNREEIERLNADLKKKNQMLEENKKDLFQIKKESSSKIIELELKIKEITEQLGKKKEDLQKLKSLLDQREMELKRLGEEIEYKNQRLASKDMEMESDKKVSKEKILLLEARVKELEGRSVEPPSGGETEFALYKKNRQKGQTGYQFSRKISLFGCDEGFIPWLLGKQIPETQKEPYLWHLQIENALANAGYPNSTLFIIPKPKQKKTNLSLYEVIEVWGYSASGWTPILLYLSRVFVGEDPQKFDRNDFWIRNDERDEPIYTVLYLDGTISNGKLIGHWNAPPDSPTNAALLWPDTLGYFFHCIREQIPYVLY
jgi:hypothetical protein